MAVTEYGTQPGWWHDYRRCWWQFHDQRGQLVATITDESIARSGCVPGDLWVSN